MKALRSRWFPWAVVVVVVGCLFLCNRHNGPETGIDGSVIQTIEKILASGFHAADVAEKPRINMVPDVDPKVITETVYIQGSWIPDTVYTPGDTVTVTAEGIGLINGSRFVRLSIDGKPVAVDISEWYGPSPGRLERRWQIHTEVVAVCDRPEIGIGVGYRICEPLGIGISPAVTVGVELRWAAGELRLTRRVWSGVSIGGGCGYRIGEDTGLHLSGGVSIEL